MSMAATTIAGIRIPDSALARDVTQFVQDVASPLLFDHSRRVFLWASQQGQKHGLRFDPELLYVGAMFHDVGLVESYRSPDQRFEIDGANAAQAFLEERGLPHAKITTVWDSVALHTTPEIPRYKAPEVWLVTLGVQFDVVGLHLDDVSAEHRAEVIAVHPLTGFKTGIVEAFFDGMRDKPQTAIGTINIDIVEAKLPGYSHPNLCDLIANSRLEG
jgi:hypothetical protein